MYEASLHLATAAGENKENLATAGRQKTALKSIISEHQDSVAGVLQRFMSAVDCSSGRQPPPGLTSDMESRRGATLEYEGTYEGP